MVDQKWTTAHVNHQLKFAIYYFLKPSYYLDQLGRLLAHLLTDSSRFEWEIVQETRIETYVKKDEERSAKRTLCCSWLTFLYQYGKFFVTVFIAKFFIWNTHFNEHVFHLNSFLQMITFEMIFFPGIYYYNIIFPFVLLSLIARLLALSITSLDNELEDNHFMTHSYLVIRNAHYL